MKKKGLIISTVVMVVVLIASLTTATYAWFSVSNKTTIDGFSLQVVAGNAVNIGLRKNLTETYSPDDLDSKFTTGDIAFDGGTPGTLNSGNWTGGTDGFGPQLTHHIVFGDVKRAVAFTTVDKNAITNENTSYMPSNPTGYKVVSAAKSQTSNDLVDKQLAQANGYSPDGGTQQVLGDYAYMWLGVSPAKTLKEGAILHVYVKSEGTGTQLGIAAAVHVAYSINGGPWTDVDAFEGKNFKTAKTAAQTKMAVDATDAFDVTATKGSVQNGMADVAINLTKTVQAEFDQVQVVVYLAGNDPDCNDNAKGVTAKIGMFFETIDENITAKTVFAETKSATIDNKGILTVEGGVADAVVEYSVENGAWVKANGSWTGTKFTSAVALASTKGKNNVRVRIRETDKLSSDPITVTNNYTV